MDGEDLLATVGSTWLETEYGVISMIGITALDIMRDQLPAEMEEPARGALAVMLIAAMLVPAILRHHGESAPDELLAVCGQSKRYLTALLGLSWDDIPPAFRKAFENN
jgi:hypothetical protein